MFVKSVLYSTFICYCIVSTHHVQILICYTFCRLGNTIFLTIDASPLLHSMHPSVSFCVSPFPSPPSLSSSVSSLSLLSLSLSASFLLYTSLPPSPLPFPALLYIDISQKNYAVTWTQKAVVERFYLWLAMPHNWGIVYSAAPCGAIYCAPLYATPPLKPPWAIYSSMLIWSNCIKPLLSHKMANTYWPASWVFYWPTHLSD